MPNDREELEALRRRKAGIQSPREELETLRARKAGILDTRRNQQPSPAAQPQASPGRTLRGDLEERFGQERSKEFFSNENLVDDAVRGVASGLTANMADEIAALGDTLVGGEIPSAEDILTSETESTFAQNLAAQRARDEAADPRVRGGGEIVGALALGTGLARRGISSLAGAKRTLPSLAGRGAAEGAAFGGAFGVGSAEGGVENRLAGGARGGAVGALTGGTLGAVARGVVGPRPTNPTVEAIREQSTAAYKVAEDAGVIIKKTAVKQMTKRLENRLAIAGVDRTLHPNVVAVTKRLREAGRDNQTLEGMEILRRVSKGASGSNVADERRLGRIIVKEIDDFVGNLKSADTLAGNAPEATAALSEARKLWSISSKATAIDDLFQRAGVRAGQFSGSGFENALRVEFRSLALNAKRMRQFTAGEQKFIKQVAKGTGFGNALRALGKAAPTGVVSTVLSGAAGFGIGGPVGAVALPAAGGIARKAATSISKGNVQSVLDEVLSPVTQGAVNVAPRQADLLRASILGTVEGEQLSRSLGRRNRP